MTKVILKVEVKNTLALFVATKCAPKTYKLNVSWTGKDIIIIRKLDSDKSLDLISVEEWIKDKRDADVFNVIEYRFIEDMDNNEYNFSEEGTYNIIELHMRNWARQTNTNKFILGISGGKDSTVVAMLLASIFGPENVYGVLLPCGEQKDISDSFDVASILKIHSNIINIGDAFDSIINQVPKATYDTKTNLPARLRMAAIFALGQTVNAKMINTCNLSEDMVGYATLFGDCSGCYAPIQNLTVTEIRWLGKWIIDNKLKLEGADRERMIGLIDKVPVDGLQPLSDEEKLGFTYDELDAFIRLNKGTDEFKAKIREIYQKNKFKLDIVNLQRPYFPYNNFVIYENGYQIC